MRTEPMRGLLFVSWGLLAVAAALAFLLGRPVWALDAAVVSLFQGAIYLLRRTLNLTPLTFGLILSAGLAHCFAVTGLYGRTFWGVEYDSIIHTYTNIVFGIAAYRYMRKFDVSKAEAAAVGFLFTMGLGVVNEIIEYVGYRIGGEGEGLFLLGPGDVGAENAFDNLMTDFLHNAFGGVIGVGLSALSDILRGRSGKSREAADLPESR